MNLILGIILGIIIGLLLAIIAMLSVRRYQTKIERTIKRVENFTKEKGEVFVDEDSKLELESFLDSLPKE